MLPCCQGTPFFRDMDPDQVKSNDLDKEIHQWMKQYNKAIKLLLLGAGESGKTTIIKQMKILHIQGFSEEEVRDKIVEIRRNIFESIRDITKFMPHLEPPVALQDVALQSQVDIIHGIDVMGQTTFTEEQFEAAKNLWMDGGVQESFRRSNEYPLIDCAKYFLDRIDDIRRDDFSPSHKDILHSRRTTTDIQKIEFTVRVGSKYGGGSQSFWMFDVGGQRGERRKWIQVFDGISAVLFLVDSSGFNAKIREDNETNRLLESVQVFREVWSSRFLRDAGFILFLNKQDILKDKLEQGWKLEDYFPDFSDYKPLNRDDESDEYLKARTFIRDLFLSVAKENKRRQTAITIEGELFSSMSKKRECFTHFTIATDTDNIKRVFDDVHTMIIMNNLKAISTI